MNGLSSFVKQFFTNTATVGSLFPSTPFLTGKMLENIDFKRPITVVELGPGTGVFTRALLRRMSADSRVIAFELNEVFQKKLSKRFNDSRLTLVKDSAENFVAKAKELGFPKIDYVLSSLPLMNLPDQVGENIIANTLDCLDQNGLFIQYQYSLEAKRLLEANFNKITLSYTALNIPPAFIYTCKNDNF